VTTREAKALVALLKAAFPRQALEQATLEVYAKYLADLDAAIGRIAVERLIATSRFFPTIAEIREQVATMQCDDMPEPELAWQEVCDELRRVGHSKAPEFSCQEIHDAVRAVGGWMYLCLAPTNASDRSRFIDAYRVARGRTMADAQRGQYLVAASEEGGKQLRGEPSELAKILAKQLTAKNGVPE
jgi:hypothetical protein